MGVHGAMIRRIPISLKFDDTAESDFYNNLIEKKRIDRELSNLIVDLLHVYYENEDFRATVDHYQEDKNPYLIIQGRIATMALEHSKNVQSAAMLSDYTENEKKKLEQQKAAEEAEKYHKNSAEVLQKIDETPALLDDIKKTYNLVEKDNAEEEIIDVEYNDARKSMLAEKSEPTGVDVNEIMEEPVTVAEPIDVEKPKVEVPKVSEVRQETRQEGFNFTMEKPNMQGRVNIQSSEESASKLKTEPSEVPQNTVEEASKKVRKPASFGKLMKSMESEG